MFKSTVAVVALVALTGPAISAQFYPANSLDSVALIGPPAELGTAEFD